MLLTVVSKSKSKPSTKDDPKGRSAEEPDCSGPKMAQMLFAAVTASSEEENPPSV